MHIIARIISQIILMILITVGVSAKEGNSNKSTQVFFGDTHLHTKLSPDAFANLNRTVAPDDAYHFAKWQWPDEVIFVDEIPKSSVGKFSKKEIRAEYADFYTS